MQTNALPALVVADDEEAPDESVAGFFLMRSLSGLKIDGGGGGGAGGGGGGRSFCSATSNLFTKSTSKAVITIAIRVSFDYDTTTIRLRRKIDMLIFCSRRIASRRRMETGARDTS